MLEVERFPSFLSPSALNMAETSPNKFYIQRLSGLGIEKESQTLAAAIGSAFDYYIKENIIKNKIKNKVPLLEEMKKSIEQFPLEAFGIGRDIYNEYIKYSFDINEYEDVEIHENYSLNLKEFFGIDCNIPIFMKIDAIKIKENKLYIHDWKVSGYTSLTGMSPKPGFYRIWDKGMLKSCHDSYSKDIKLEEIDLNWATQLCTYGWKLYPLGEPFSVTIDLLIFNDRNEMRIVQYLAWITHEFQRSVAFRYATLWQNIVSENFINKLASNRDINLVYIASLNETWW